MAVWGPTGAPGRTTVAVGIADEAARLGTSTLLVDADVYGGVIAQVLGLLDESPGLAGAARLAGSGRLDGAAVVRLAWAVRPHLRVLTGLARADRWPELRPRAVAAVLEEARRLAGCTVVDCSFNLEDDEELSFDTAAPRRNGATLAVLEAADTVLCVSGADPVALQRSVRALDELRDVLPEVEPVVVVNQVRRGPVPGTRGRRSRPRSSGSPAARSGSSSRPTARPPMPRWPRGARWPRWRRGPRCASRCGRWPRRWPACRSPRAGDARRRTAGPADRRAVRDQPRAP